MNNSRNYATLITKGKCASGKINSIWEYLKEMSKKENLFTSPNKLIFLSNNHSSHQFEALPSEAD